MPISMTGMKTDSVANGGATIVLARVIGMGCAFLLFVLLARQSDIQVGVFRAAVTFMVISEFIGLLGTQRWLVVAIAPEGPNRWQLFLAGSALAVMTAILIALVYLGISFSGVYGEDISRGLQLVALATLPAALLTNIQATLVGIGWSQRMGLLNLLENVVRSVVSIACVIYGLGVLSVIVVFVVCRWLVVLFGLVMVFRQLKGFGWWPQSEFVCKLIRQVPRFILIMVSFLIIRNAALVLLPALVDEREVALFAVPYQLYDLALLVPTILAISSNFLFVTRAERGNGALRWVVTQLWSLTSVFLLPLVMLSLVFGSDLLHALFGQRYDASVPAFYLLMLATPLMALDQVLSQTMQSTKRFREDAISMLFGASAVVLGTIVLGTEWGATGAALTLLIALVLILIIRFVQLRTLISAEFMLRLAWRPVVAAVLVGGFCWLVRNFVLQSTPLLLTWGWLPASLLAALAYLLVLQRLGGLKASKRGRVRQFLLCRHVANPIDLVVEKHE